MKTVRRAQPVQCAKGFGQAPQPKKSGNRKGSDLQLNRGQPKVVDRAVKLVEQRSPLINPDHAAQGRVDFVKVKEWGTGNQDDIGNLEVESSVTSFDPSVATFHEVLTRQLETLQAQGALEVAQPEGSKPLPPFKAWPFAKPHYLQYLADMVCVYKAMEASVEQCSRAVQAAAAGPADEALCVATSSLGPQCGLQRASHIATDLANLGEVAPPDPTPNAASYAKYLESLAEQCTAADGAAERREPALKLITHAYILYLTLLTSGNRIGAAAAEKLNLFALEALHTYRSFPEGVVRPVETLINAINVVGDVLEEEDKEAVLEELARAMQRTSLLLVPLAVSQ